MMLRKFSLFTICLFIVHVAAYADNVADALSHKYKGRVLALRSPFTYGDQKFDSNGQLLTAPPKGPWLLYGGIYIEHLDLSSDTLSLEGHRVGLGADKKGKPAGIPLEKTVRIEIRLDKPFQSIEEAEAVLNRVFFLDGDNDDKDRTKPEDRLADDNSAKEKIYRLSDGIVKPPHATYTPEPEFSEKARKANFQGVVILHIVVDKTGRISRVRLERALGNGLDENAMETVKLWRFDPATLNGGPVSVELNIEVSFNLYSAPGRR